MKRHYLGHLEIRPVACQLCPKRFIDKDALARHMPYHSDVRAFPCDFCGSMFKTRNDVGKHITRMHRELLAMKNIKRDS